MTKKQNDFVNEYIRTGNATASYRKAFDCKNMKPKTITDRGYDLLHHPKIIDRIALVGQVAFENQVLNKEWVIERLMLNAQMALGEIPIKSTTKQGVKGQDGVVAYGDEIVNLSKRVDHAAASKALELLGKTDGVKMFVDRSEVDVKNEYAAMSDEELEGYIDERLK